MAGDDPVRLAFLRKQPCSMCGRWATDEQGNDAHHHTGRRVGRKASDANTFPLCRGCHMEFHAGKGHFEGWNHQRKSEWQDSMVAMHTANKDAF